MSELVTRRVGAMVARSLDAPAAALPILAEWLAPLQALGSSPRRVVNWLRAAGVDADSRVLELACGKGAVAVALAKGLGCRVQGVDAFPPFVESAREAARRRGVADLCEFRVGLIEHWLCRARAGRRPTFDAALMLNAWPVTRAAPLLHRLTRPGGVYVVDDAVRMPERDRAGDFAGQPTADAVAALIERLGDRIERRHVVAPAEAKRHEMALYHKLARQAARMIRRRPAVRRLLDECLAAQRSAIADLTGALRPALWLVRRGRAR